MMKPDTKKQRGLITDSQELHGATTRFDNEIPVYDDGMGNLYIHWDSMGINGVVRAMSWEDAYSIVEDEFMPDADESHEDWIKEYGENYMEDGAWNECYGFRNNSPCSTSPHKSSIYAKDLNGDALDELTHELIKQLGIKLDIGPDYKWDSLDDMIRSDEFQDFQSDKLGNNLFINDPDRADRIHKYAEDGINGSMHCEIIDDWLEFLELQSNEIPQDLYDDLKEEIDSVEQWHIDNGSYEQIIG